MQVIPMIRLLILSLLLSLTPGASFASATSCPTLQRGVSSWSNPLTPTVRRAARPTQTPSATITCGSFWQLVQVLGAQGTARTPAFVADLVYDFSFNQVESIVSAAMDSALAQDDYLRFTFSGYQVRYRGTDGHVAIEFDFRYLTDATQEAFVNQRVAALDAQLTEAGMTDEEREIAAHDWVVKNVEYDRAEVSGDVRYTAYGALSNGVAVCQGYALLVYRLLDAAGLEARIVPAEVDHGRKHAWNMVRVCGTWYHLDATWDDPVTDPPASDRVRYDYFNLSDMQLRRDHSWSDDGRPAAISEYTSGVCAGQTDRLLWSRDRAAVMEAAAAQHKRVLVVAGYPDSLDTKYTLETVIQWYWPPVRPLLAADFLVWACDLGISDAWQPLAAGMGSFQLPLLAVVDPRQPDAALARTSGPYCPAAFLEWLRPWASTAITSASRTSWGRIKLGRVRANRAHVRSPNPSNRPAFLQAIFSYTAGAIHRFSRRLAK